MKKYLLLLTFSIFLTFTFNIVTFAVAVSEDQIPQTTDSIIINSIASGIQTGVMWTDYVSDPTWKLHLGTGDRYYERFIPFDTPFSSTPKVMLSLIGFDSDNRITSRIAVSPVNISTNGFYISVKTWWDSILYMVGVSWIAFN